MDYYEAEQLKVAEAARVLDRIKPKWCRRVDITKLSMGSATNCILGQVFKSQWFKPWRWTAWPYTTGRKAMSRAGFGSQYGIFVSDRVVPYWEKEIKKRTTSER